MLTEKKGHRFWIVREGNVILAEIVLDYFYQIADIIFRAVNPDDRRAVKELATSHVMQFEVRRTLPVLGGLMVHSVQNPHLTEQDSDGLMSFEQVPAEIKKLNTKELDRCLTRAGVGLVDGDYPSSQAVFDKAVNYIKQTHGVKLTYSVSRSRLNDTQFEVEFKVHGGPKFRLWKHVDTPNEDIQSSDSRRHHICPSYHPFFSGGQEIGLINGSTDTLIGAHELGIVTIKCPKESRTGREGFVSVSWDRVKHPFYGEGKTLEMRISFVRILSQKAYELLLRILLGALNLEKLYVQVLGGFCSPYPYPQRPRGHRSVRGCEHDVVWEYRTLVKEGRLDGSILPEWFMQEGWLDAYPENEVTLQ